MDLEIVIPKTTLAECEATIARGLSTFIEVGNALRDIRDQRLYREQCYATFEEYCRKRWELSKTHANRQIEAASVVQNLTPIGVTPKNEAQARELTRLSPEQQREVARSVNFQQVTACELKEIVQRKYGKTGKQKPIRTEADKSTSRAAAANKQRARRIARLKRICCLLASMPQPVTMKDIVATQGSRSHALASQYDIFPWFHMEVVPHLSGYAYRCSINEDLKAICDTHTPTASGFESPARFLGRLHAELHHRREELDRARRGRKWDLDKLNKLEFLNLFDWFERELLTYGQSVNIRREGAPNTLQLIEQKESA